MSDKKAYLGEFEEIVLLAVWSLADNAYGVTIRQAVEEKAKRSTSIGAIYTTLDRLEQKGYVRSHIGEATPERGGRAKRYFKILGAGIEALQDAEWARRRLSEGLNLGLQPFAKQVGDLGLVGGF